MSLYEKMFVVIDPTQEKQPALKRAAEIAKKTKSSLTVFSAIYKSIEDMGAAKSRKSGKTAELKAWDAKVKKMIEPVRAKGLTVKSDRYWTADWYAAVSRAALRSGANLVVKSTFRHGKLQRLLHSTSDFTIMRHSPVPVLLVREDRKKGKSVVAAIDLESQDEGHMGLNNAVLKHAKEYALAVKLPLHIVAAVSKKKADFSHILGDVDLTASEQHEALAKEFGIKPSMFHLEKGDAKRVIVAQAKELGADTLTIGVSACSGAKGVLVGTTVQKIIDKLDCDVLAVN
ncbi:MAG: universal stress protein [Pseudohongiellaceae bacterium]|nr:universal stress protein [Pseudohongiellaceae bacterium]